MAINDLNSAAFFEGLISGDPTSEDFFSIFSSKKIKIVSPTVSGLLSSNDFGFDGLGISSCFNFDNNTVNIEDGGHDLNSILKNNTDDKESESSNEDFVKALSSFVDKVKSTRSSFLPFELYNGAMVTSESLNNVSEMESYENTFMRMLGMPDDRDFGNSVGANGADVFDSSKKVIYASPRNSDGLQFVQDSASIAEITGETAPVSDIFANIIEERQRIPSSTTGWGRFFNFGNVIFTEEGRQKYERIMEEKINAAGGDSTLLGIEDTSLNYYDPNQLFRFYYLKSVPLQSSKIYGCISEPDKVILKPFDPNSSSKINGIKPRTSLLETIIRIRLDKITGAPGAYSYVESEKNNGRNPITIEGAKNVGNEDTLTQVECFLLQKLKNVLIETAKKYKEDINTLAVQEATEKHESAGGDGSDNKDFQSEIANLEILKAREDAILFLLKDRSSSSDVKNYDSSYSSLDIQKGIIRSTSGFDDALSGPLYEILSQRSNYIEKKIKELTASIKSKKKLPEETPPFDKTESGGTVSYTYLGVCSEDFIVYTMALLSLNEDYLIGLLPQKNRVYLANVISASSLSSKKDPYGIIDRVNKSVEKGGFPSVSDSVNALSLLVCRFYSLYLTLIIDSYSNKLFWLSIRQTTSN